MITRKEYMANSEKLHHAYYLQIALKSGLTKHHLPAFLPEIKEALKTDRHLNNIPLLRWDARAANTKQLVTKQITIAEEFPAGPSKVVWSLGDGVCILKALAKHLVSTIQVGTSHFHTQALANEYYAKQGLSPDDVARKIADGEIHIGPPDIKDNERLILIDGCRFAIESDADYVTR